LDFEQWSPYYHLILHEFGFSEDMDLASGRILASIIDRSRICSPKCVSASIGREVTVCGDGPGLETSLRKIQLKRTVIAADGATSCLMDLGVVPDLIVTDLDGSIDPQLEANSLGAIAVIHAHGDNMDAIRTYVPRFVGRITPTTQAEPWGPLMNFGGFTDGDRAVMLARHFGAEWIDLVGFDFENPKHKQGKDPESKKRKLAWAKRLIYDLNPPSVSLSTP
jgi:2-amino-4-hydroxy-6-hydroxymethyldihydropteridine diphosphokinase